MSSNQRSRNATKTPKESIQSGFIRQSLDLAEKCRRPDYGPPSEDFGRVAAMWSALKGVEFKPHEVAMFLICVKLSRQAHSNKHDNWVDIIGYADCGHACSAPEAWKPNK